MPETAETTTEHQQESETSDFQPITLASQAEVDNLVKQRVARERAKFADYNDVKAKAAELDSLKAAQRSQTENDAERIRALENELTTERHQGLRRDVAAAKGVPADRITGTTREELETSADELLAFINEQHEQLTKQAPPKRPGALKSGATGTDTRMDPKERAAEALRRLRSG